MGYQTGGTCNWTMEQELGCTRLYVYSVNGLVKGADQVQPKSCLSTANGSEPGARERLWPVCQSTLWTGSTDGNCHSPNLAFRHGLTASVPGCFGRAALWQVCWCTLYLGSIPLTLLHSTSRLQELLRGTVPSVALCSSSAGAPCLRVPFEHTART